MKAILASRLLIAWLALVAWEVWRHVVSSKEPLIGDARSYWLKAENFWHSVGGRRFFNPFDVYPTVRPPGTVLMSYPFGFTESTRGFLFRSIYLAIALTAGATYVAARSIPSNPAKRVDVACLALFMCSLPLFYHFEYRVGSPTYWGLVDAFFAGSAALAVSLALLGGARGSPLATVAAALVSGLCFTIKPAGLLVILLTATSFSLAAGANFATVLVGSPRKKFSQSFWVGIAAFALVNGPLIYVGRHSGYFSDENVAFGNRAVIQLREAWLLPSLSQLGWNVHTSLSFILLGTLALTLSAGLLRFRRLREIAMSGSSATAFAGWISAILYLGVGVWFWMIYTGGSQIRFFYPFVLSAAVCLIPLSLLIFDGTNGTVRTLTRCALILPSLNIAVLLALSNPPPGWQRLSGVNVSIHPESPDLALARRLLNEIRERKESAVVYEEPWGVTRPLV